MNKLPAETQKTPVQSEVERRNIKFDRMEPLEVRNTNIPLPKAWAPVDVVFVTLGLAAMAKLSLNEQFLM